VKWKETNPQAAAHYGFENYVQYVQDKWAEKIPEQEKTGTPEIRELARQMARTDERRAASMFHPTKTTEPIRALSPAELLAQLAPDEARLARLNRREQLERDRAMHDRYAGLTRELDDGFDRDRDRGRTR
jgi:hypothetical protein